jgi:hypothetical protein
MKPETSWIVSTLILPTTDVNEKNLSIPLARVNYYLLSPHPALREASLHRYRKIHLITWWIYLLRLWIYLPGSVDLYFFGLLDLSSSGYHWFL